MLDGVPSVLTSLHVIVGVLERRIDVESRLDASPHVGVGVLVALVTLSWSFHSNLVICSEAWRVKRCRLEAWTCCGPPWHLSCGAVMS